MNQSHFMKRLKSLNAQCIQLLKQDGIFRHGQFYRKLGEFINAYNDAKKILAEDLSRDNEMIRIRVEALPEIEFRDYDGNKSLRNWGFSFFLVIFFPIGIFYLINKHRYVNSVKYKLRQTYQTLSSIEFLAKAQLS